MIAMVRANGLNFEVEQSGDGERLALCLHGFPELSYSWRYQIPLLVKLGYRVWAPNQRGYGRSSRPPNAGAYAIEQLMDDVAGLIDASGAKRVTLIAHDWGGAVAWYFAMRRIRPIERLVIMNVPHPALMGKAMRTRTQRRRSWYIFFFQLPWLPEWRLSRNGARDVARMFRGMAVDKSRFPPEVLDVYRSHACQPGALRAMLNWYRAAVLGGGFVRQHRLGYPIIDVPTLVIWGEADRALGKETTYGTERYVSDLTLRYLPNVSHWVQQEAPEIVNAMLEAFLTGTPVPEITDLG